MQPRRQRRGTNHAARVPRLHQLPSIMAPDVLRIAVFGPESTGKTRLAAKLAAHFRAPLVAEYAREFWDAQGLITLEDIPGIAREQWRREDEAVAKAAKAAETQSHIIDDKSGGAARAPLVICDTEALTTVLWSDLLYGTTPEDVRRGAERRARNYALYLLLDTDVPFAPDPQRCFPEPEDREKCRRVWHGALKRRHLPFVEIRGDWAERERTAIAAVAALLGFRGDVEA
ncbi:MAG: N-acetylglucosamine-6-sulfatase [Opitutus sp.]|nr:N-acetylglucosamine-6-sulfatase [Opitutus sp.]